MEIQVKCYHRVYAEVDLNAIVCNIRALKQHIAKGIAFCAVIKANGYGHGALAVAKAVEKEVDFLAVATAEEAHEIRKSGIQKPILILSYVHPSYFPMLIRESIRPTIFRLSDAEAFSDAALREKKEGVCHIGIDTGMSRIGFAPTRESAQTIQKICGLPGLRVEGLFTHFACSDEGDRSFSDAQYSAFQNMINYLREYGISIPLCHCSNSAAILDYKEFAMNMVRAGIVIYGLYPSKEVNRHETLLRPAMALKSNVIMVKELEPNTPVSYGGTYRTTSKQKIATIPVGYGDGYPRSLSNKGYVLIKGQKAPIVGRVCMDQFMVDVTEIEGVTEGDTVTLMGKDGSLEITADELAELTGTISYEIICGFGARVTRVYT